MGRTLDEHASKRLLAEYGVPVVDERIVATPEAAIGAAEELGYPVVVKAVGDRIAHKTERGLVRLGLDSPGAVERAATELLQVIRPDDGDVALLVAPMVRGSRELIAGVHRDDRFGPCVMIGIGGVTAEVLADVAFRLVPLDPIDVDDMLEELRGRALLDAFRGEPAVDRDALRRVVLGLSELATARPDVRSVDVNPLIVAGGEPVAVDALVELDVAAP